MTGSSIVDAVFQNIEIAKRHGDALSRFGLAKGKYFLLTVHRAENVDVQSRLEGIIYGSPGDRKGIRSPCYFSNPSDDTEDALHLWDFHCWLPDYPPLSSVELVALYEGEGVL